MGVRVSKYFAAADQYNAPPPRLVSVTTLSPSRPGAVTSTGSGAVSDAASKVTVFTATPFTETSTSKAAGVSPRAFMNAVRPYSAIAVCFVLTQYAPD